MSVLGIIGGGIAVIAAFTPVGVVFGKIVVIKLGTADRLDEVPLP